MMLAVRYSRQGLSRLSFVKRQLSELFRAGPSRGRWYTTFTAQGVERGMARVVSFALSWIVGGILSLALGSDGKQLPSAPQPGPTVPSRAVAKPKIVGDGACLGCHKQY